MALLPVMAALAPSTILGEPSLPAPTHAAVAYGPHERNVLDLWLADTEEPAPLLVYIHGGSWLGNGRGSVHPNLVAFSLENGIHIASIDYRYSSQAPLPAPVHDAARALQFLRAESSEWNIDKTRVTLEGVSAGGCTALWLALHDDLADPKSEDPVLRESTRVLGAAVNAAQTSIDPPIIGEWLGDEVLNHNMIIRAAGALSRPDMERRYEELAPLYREFSPINHLDAEDPPIFASYARADALPATNPNRAIHHAEFGRRLAHASTAAGHEFILHISGGVAAEKNKFHLRLLNPQNEQQSPD